MAFKVFAMDTFFLHSLGMYTFEARCEMLEELGYDGTYLTLYGPVGWENLPKLPSVKERYGIEVARVWSILDVAGKKDNQGNRRVLEMLESVQGCDTIELAMMSRCHGTQKPTRTPPRLSGPSISHPRRPRGLWRPVTG